MNNFVQVITDCQLPSQNRMFVAKISYNDFARLAKYRHGNSHHKTHYILMYVRPPIILFLTKSASLVNFFCQTPNEYGNLFLGNTVHKSKLMHACQKFILSVLNHYVRAEEEEI